MRRAAKSTPKSLRLDGWNQVTARSYVTFWFEGRQMRGYVGESIAAALIANEVTHLRWSPRLRSPRGAYCGIGLCYECEATVDGCSSVRTCVTPLVEGMQVARQWLGPQDEIEGVHPTDGAPTRGVM